MDLVAADASVSFSPVLALQPEAACGELFNLFDPLEADDRADVPVLTTERRLRRLAIVAADTGARFERERIVHDPVAWLLAPRLLFDGRRAIDACQDRTGFLRATLLNGLSLGLDANPDEVDDLADDGNGNGNGDEAPARSHSTVMDAALAEPRFFACSIDSLDCLAGGAVVWLMIAVDEGAARERLRECYGFPAERAVVWEVIASPERLARADDFLSKLLVVLLAAAGDASEGVEFRLEIGRFS
jgi:hypothetical protein